MIRVLLATSVALFFAASSHLAHAGAQQGVKCPSGFEASISSDQRHLTCRKTNSYEHASICSPLAFSSRGVKVLGNIVMEPTGSDQCLAVVSGNKTPSIMEPPAPGEPPYTAFRRVVNSTGPDKFIADGVVEYTFPTGGRPYIGNAAGGVTCPAGFDGDSVYNGDGIRCDKKDGAPRGADCDGVAAGPVAIGWQLRRDFRQTEDRCVPVGSGSDGPTKPVGMTKIQHDAERSSDSIGWVLAKKTGGDTWQRKVYEFPSN